MRVNDLDYMRTLINVYHADQRYGDNPYTYHLYQVENEVIGYCSNSEQDLWDEREYDLRIIALGHDLLEDTTIDISLLSRNFSGRVVTAIDAITKREGESRKEYLNRCKLNEMALIVKKCDTMCNLRQSYLDGNYKRIKKYSEQLTYLFKE